MEIEAVYVLETCSPGETQFYVFGVYAERSAAEKEEARLAAEGHSTWVNGPLRIR